MGLFYFILGHYYLVIPYSIQIWGKNPYFLNIFNFGQFWPAEIDKKAGRPAGWSTGRPVKISNPGMGFGFEKIMDLTMDVDKLNLANFVG